MHTAWIKGFTSGQIEDRKKKVQSYQTALSALQEVIEANLKKKESLRDYDSPGWEYRQIAVNEYNHALEDVIKLLNVKDN